MNPQDEMQKTILAELGIESWPQEKQKEVLATLGGPLFESVMVAIFEKIPQEKRPELQAAMESADARRVTAIINEHIPNSAQIIEETVQNAVAQIKKFKEGGV